MNRMDRKKEKEVQKRINFLNVVIYPEERQSARRYVDILMTIKDKKIAVNTHADKITQVETLEQEGDFYIGKLVNFTSLDGNKWFNKDTNTVEHFSFDLNIYPNAKEWSFFFMPSLHRIALIGNEKPSLTQIQKFFQSALNHVVNEAFDESVEVNIVSSATKIEEILSSSITSLEIKVTYSNNDLNEDMEALIDQEMKRSKVRQIGTKATGTKKNPLLINENRFLKGLTKLSRNNGYAIATGLFQGKYQKVSTKKFPHLSFLKYKEGNMLSQLKHLMQSLFDKHE